MVVATEPGLISASQTTEVIMTVELARMNTTTAFKSWYFKEKKRIS